MTTSAEQINDLIQAGNDWKTQADALLTDRVAHQQAYQALAGNLRTVVSQEMYWTITLDPTAPAEVPGRNGTYLDLQSALDDAPRGAMISVSVPAGRVIDVAAILAVKRRYVRITCADLLNPARLRFAVGDNGVVNTLLGRISLLYGSHLQLGNMELEISPKSDAGLGWDTGGAIQCALAQSASVYMDGCELIGPSGAKFISLFQNHTTIGLRNVSTTGPVRIVGDVAAGTGTISTGVVTLDVGAEMRDDGGVGTNILEN